MQDRLAISTEPAKPRHESEAARSGTGPWDVVGEGDKQVKLGPVGAGCGKAFGTGEDGPGYRVARNVQRIGEVLGWRTRI